MVFLAAQLGAATRSSFKGFVEVLSRKLFSVLAAAAVSGGALIAPAAAAPVADAAQEVAEQMVPAQTDADKYSVTYPSTYLMQGDSVTLAPLETDLPAGTTTALDEGAALEAFRADRWSISVTDSVLSVSSPQTAEGDYRIPLIVTYPDESTEAVSAEILVDYYVDTNLIRLSAREIVKFSSMPGQSSR